MKHSYKRLFALVLVLALVLAGCGGGGSSSSSNGAPASGGGSQPSSTESGGGEPSGSGSGTAGTVVPTEVKISGGTTGGSWNIATTIIGNILTEELGLRTTVTPGAALSNIVAVQNGEIQLSVSKAPTTFDGFNAVEPFPSVMDKVMNVGWLYDEATHIIVAADSGIETVDDLRGKRLTTFATGNTAEVICRHILQVYDLTYDDMQSVSFASLNDMGEQFKDGLTDALCFASAVPVSVVMDIASVRDIKLLDISDEKLDALQEISPSYMRNVIPAGTYKGQEADNYTMGNAQHLIVSSDLDEEFVYTMMKAIVENLDLIGEGHVVYAALTPELMAQDLKIPMHPGAERYYREIGAIQ